VTPDDERLRELARDLADSGTRTEKRLADACLDLLRRLDLWHEYAELLGAELFEIVPFTVNHGWRSTRHEEGKRLRGLLGIKGDSE